MDDALQPPTEKGHRRYQEAKQCVCVRERQGARAQQVISYSLLPACPSSVYLLLSDLVSYDSIFNFVFSQQCNYSRQQVCDDHRLSVVFNLDFIEVILVRQNELEVLFVKEFVGVSVQHNFCFSFCFL